jgi:energy-coupling factor transport system substrate-specific component
MTWELASFALLAIALAAGFAWYERSHPPAKVLALVATLAALAALGRLAFAPLPNIKPTTDIVLLSGYVLGGAPGFAVGTIAALASNFFFGQGPYTPFQMAGWGAIGILGALLPKGLGRYSLALVCGAAGLLYGLWMDFHLWLLYTGHSFAEYGVVQARGLPFNVAHVVGNVAFCLVFGPTLVTALQRFRRRFEIVWHPAPVAGAALAVLALAAPLAIAQQSSVTKAADYVEAARTPDGGFAGRAGATESDPVYTGWAAIGLAAAGRSPGAATGAYLAEQGRKVTDIGDIERTILALRAAGQDTEELTDRLASERARDGSYERLVNRTAFAVLAFKADGRRQDRRTLRWLVRRQNRDGGYGLTGRGPSGVDDTASVIQALAAAGRRKSRTVKRAVRWLVRQRNPDGGFPLTPRTASNAQSTAFAVQALVAARRKPGRSIAYLRSLQGPDGSVRYSRTSTQTPVWVTSQALAAMARKPLPVAPAKGRLVTARRAGTLLAVLFSPLFE